MSFFGAILEPFGTLLKRGWSQQPFSLNPDPDRNKEDASIISVVAYCVDIQFSLPTQFCHLLPQKFRGKCHRFCQDPGTLDPRNETVLLIFMGLKSFLHRRSLLYKTLFHRQSGAILRSAVAHHVLPESTFKDKSPQDIEHVWLQTLYSKM